MSRPTLSWFAMSMRADAIQNSLVWMRSVTPMRWPSSAGNRSFHRSVMSAFVES